jgi:hypothetical protein
MAALPLLTFDTNVLMDIWLGRDGDQAVLLLKLAEDGQLELLLAEFVLFEFRGTALRWLREQHSNVEATRRLVNAWDRSEPLAEAASDIRSGMGKLVTELEALARNVDLVIQRVRAIASVKTHTLDIHFRGDLRYLSGYPPDRPVDGLKDCRIYEAVLEIMKTDMNTTRPRKVFATKDGDFTRYSDLVAEIQQCGFELRSDLGRLYGELRPGAPPP